MNDQYIKSKVYIAVQPEEIFVPLVVSFVEKSAIAFGMESLDALALTLSADEIFSYLCKISNSNSPVEIYSKNGVYCVEVEIIFEADNFNFTPFNIASRIKPDDDDSLKKLGLTLASRSVELIYIKKINKNLHLTIVKEKSYPEIDLLPEIASKPLEKYSVSFPNKDEIKLFVQLLIKYGYAEILPDLFKKPGKLIDMVDAGEYRIALITGNSGEIGGGILWTKRKNSKSIECFGPYIFNQPLETSMQKDLLDTCISYVARTDIPGIIRYCYNYEKFHENFEDVGTMTMFNKNGNKNLVKAYFRQINEDTGSTVWCHYNMEDYLKKEYIRLSLPREIISVYDCGEYKYNFSLLGTFILKMTGIAFLMPLKPGRDIKENLFNHLSFFERERIRNIFCDIDLAHSWQSEFIPPLIELGFKPVMLIPYGGDGDLLSFQYEEEK